MNYGNHNRNLGGRHGGYTDDEWEQYRENRSSRGSDWVAPGKTVRPDHYKMPLGDQTTDDAIRILLGVLNSRQVNKVEIWYKLGCAYKKKGDKENARRYLTNAARQGHADAQEELDDLKVLDETSAIKREDGPTSSQNCPVRKVKYFAIHEIILRNGCHEFLLLVNVGDGKGLQPVSAVSKVKASDVYATRDEAMNAGKVLKYNGVT